MSALDIRPVPSSPEVAISRCGRVFRVARPRAGRTVPYELKPHHGKRGYLTVSIDGITTPIHRLVAEAFLPPDPERPEIAHCDGNRLNNHIDNLRRATRKENNDDRFDHGTVLRGRQVRSAKLHPADIAIVRRLRTDGLLQREIAERFDVSRRAIGKVLNGETWTHV